ncbi:MAG: hypothetical protein JSR17_10245 [Proteobacteria bacterium]|nr:hypothetical protein [Pseudomonadota bacterium]
MNTIAVDALMNQTRQLAALYRQTTGQTLPVSAELGRYDAACLLGLQPGPKPPIAGVDFIGCEGPYHCKSIQVKSRVIFNENSNSARIGQLNLAMPWEIVLLVLYDENYQPFAIYGATKEEVVEAIAKATARLKRGAMSLAKFKVISQLVWTQENGLEWDEIWTNGRASR